LDNTCYFFLATGALPTAPMKLDEAEELELSLEDLEKVPHLVESGQIQHALVVAAFHYLDLFKKQNPNKF